MGECLANKEVDVENKATCGESLVPRIETPLTVR
jgi:hypothetical protein